MDLDVSSLRREATSRLNALRLAIRRSRHIYGRPAFVLREIRKSRGVGAYRLRGSGLRIFLRHHLIDAFLLDEIIRDGIYDPPQKVAAALGTPRRIVDLGANIGLTTLSLLTRYPDATAVAYEPDPGNADLLKRVVSENRLEDRVRVVTACAGTSDGTVRFAADSSPLSHESDDGELVRPRVDVFPDLASADLIKIDVEGAEWPILADKRLADIRARAIVLEHHPHATGETSPADEATRLLQRAGFSVMHHHPEMLWAWR